MQKSFVLIRYQEQSFEITYLEHIERHQKTWNGFLVSFFVLSKIQNLGKGSKYERKEKRDNSKNKRLLEDERGTENFAI